jgi:uncharacterized membrane protein/thiol-disulfide isomerase/thioredoxin
MPRLARLLSLALFALALFPQTASAQSPVVHAILFYSPTCPHCQQVIQNDLPPILEEYGDSLVVVGVNVTKADGQALYQSAVQALGIPPDRRAVPTLVVGDVVLVGSGEIPEQFPGLIANGLERGGIDWPAIPGIDSILEGIGLSATPAPPETVLQRIQHDPLGNTLAIAVLLGLILVMVAALIRVVLRPPQARPLTVHWLVPLLALAGLGIALYLAYLESTGAEGVCGPIGDCNAVQQSSYARLGGILPVAWLGVAGTVCQIVAWLAARRTGEGSRRGFVIVLFGLGIFGVAFSVYLTALEPFVIGATCAWCLTSAVLQAAILLLVSGPASRAVHPSPAIAPPMAAA